MPAEFAHSISVSVEDSDYDSHSDDEHEVKPERKRQATSPEDPPEEVENRWNRFLRSFTSFFTVELTGTQKNVLKCSIAYTAASLFTFVGPLSDLGMIICFRQ